MKPKTIIVVILFELASSCFGVEKAATATSAVTVTTKQSAKLVTHKPPMQYPEQARLRRITGDGFFTMRVQRATGRVKQVGVLQTTGNNLLDAAAINWLSQWRFKPRVLRSIKEINPHSPDPLAREDCLVRVPVSFVLQKNGVITKGRHTGLSVREAVAREAQGR